MVITTPGVYCLTKALVTNITVGFAIDVQANNVVIDLNGHRLGGLGAGTGTNAIGISSLDHQNITVRNGTIRGFYTAIILSGAASRGHVVEDIRADLNTRGGILVAGSGSIIRNNTVVATGGTTIIGGPGTRLYGIITSGDGHRVLNNDVGTFVLGGVEASIGVSFSGGPGNLAAGNRITDADYGVVYQGGATGKYRDNITLGVTTPYTGGSDAGNNN
jgi:hypothetical protein